MSERAVLVLADNVLAGRRVLRALRPLEGKIEARILVTKERLELSRTRFLLGQLAVVARRFPLELPLWLWRFLNGRLVLKAAPLHDPSVLQWLSERRFWVGLHDLGVIYRESAIGYFERGILNSHIGLLPEYKGRSVMEWTLLAGKPTGISVFFIDPGIDTGREIVLRREFPVSGQGDVEASKRFLFERDGEMYRDALERLLADGFRPEENSGGRRYYVMSGLLRGVVEDLLKESK